MARPNRPDGSAPRAATAPTQAPTSAAAPCLEDKEHWHALVAALDLGGLASELAKKKVHDQKTGELQRQLKAREGLLSRLSEVRNHRFALRKAVADRINADVSPQIQVRIEQYGNTDEYRSLLASSLRNAAVQHRVVSSKIAGRVAPKEFADIVRRQDAEALLDRAELSNNLLATVGADRLRLRQQHEELNRLREKAAEAKRLADRRAELLQELESEHLSLIHI